MPSNNTSARSTALTGLALTATIAREATDGVPIVKQVMGAVSSILKLAEKIEGDREALRALADRSQKLSRRLKAVLENRAPDGQILQSLEAVRDVLHAIQSLFENLVAKTRIRRTVSYLFSVPRDVERLSAELEGALQEFLLIAALDTNVHERENSRTVGNLRRLHDFELEKLQLVADVTSEDRSCMVKYHAARVEGAGRLFVVRYLQAATVEGPAGHAEKDRRQLEEHDGILEKISSVATSHPNIAYLYGRSTGHLHNRFVVLRTGFIPLAHSAHSPGVTLSAIWSMIPKLFDAALHLTQFGAVWLPDISILGDNVFVDERGEPTIGLVNDLRSLQSVAQRTVDDLQFVVIIALLGWTHARVGDKSTSSNWHPLLAGSDWDSAYPPITDDIAAGCPIEFAHSLLHHSQFASLALNHTALAYLTQLESAFDSSSPAELWAWPQTLLRIMNGGVNRIASGVYVEYCVAPTADSWDHVLILRVVDDGGRIDYVYSRGGIPPARIKEVRQTLGIVVPDLQSGWRSFEMVHLDSPAERSPADGQLVLQEDD